MTRPVLSISIVSHSQAQLVGALLTDLKESSVQVQLEVCLTINVPEDLPPVLAGLPYAVKIIRNLSPLGFGENHNRALRLAEGDYFCVMNPDVRVTSNIFPALLSALKDAHVGVVAPLVFNKNGEIEDSARFFPTPFKIICKALGQCKGGDYRVGEARIFPDWVGGMCMLLRREVYWRAGGFNEKFFLYYEDVDLCARIWLQGLKVVFVPQVSVVHDARRSSHKKWTYLVHHVRSMLRFFMSPVCWQALYLRRARGQKHSGI